MENTISAQHVLIKLKGGELGIISGHGSSHHDMCQGCVWTTAHYTQWIRFVNYKIETLFCNKNNLKIEACFILKT